MENGAFQALFDGDGYQACAEDFLEKLNAEGLQAAVDYFGGAPDQNDYMPAWPEAERTHFMMYESTSEGTPISPAFATAEELAKWLADTRASAFAGQPATYEQWLRVCNGGYAPSAVMQDGQLISGVAAFGEPS
jgi:hypothetical protein